MAQVKFKSQEEFDAFKKKMAEEAPVDNNPLAAKGPEDQRVKTYTRPDMREGAEPAPSEQSERVALNKKLRDIQMYKEKEEQEEPTPSLRERLSQKVKNAKEFVQGTPEEVADRARRKENIKLEDKAEREVHRLEREAKARKDLEKYGGPSGSGKKKEDGEEDDEEFEKMLAEMGSGKKGKGGSIGGSSGKKPFSDDYKEVYSGKKVLSGDYKEVYKGRMGSDEYTPPKVPKTHAGFLQHEDKNYERTEQNQPRMQPQQQRAPQARVPMAMPRVGSFGNGNVKMPTMSFGGSGAMPKVGAPSTGNHKIGKGGNMPSINIPTLGGSTLIVGSGLMGKTANNKMSTGSFNIPKIGNWGKAPLKTELNLPNIGNLTIMGAGKKGGISFGLGEIPKLSLGTPQKKKKV